MKLFLITIFVFLFQINLSGIERYIEGDTLYNWAKKLNLRETPSLNSKVITQIENGEEVIVTQSKYFKEEDFQIIPNPKKWEKAITGKWVEIIYKNKKGYVFDAYLSKYETETIKNTKHFLIKESLRIPNYESYERILKVNGIIIETGIGNEIGKQVFYIPDLSMEEALYFIKESHIDKKFGKRKWLINMEDKEVKLIEKDDLFAMEVTIKKVENLCVITIEDSM